MPDQPQTAAPTPIFAGAVTANLLDELLGLFREHRAFQDFTAAVAAAIRKHPEMSGWIGDEQAKQRSSATRAAKKSAKRARR